MPAKEARSAYTVTSILVLFNFPIDFILSILKGQLSQKPKFDMFIIRKKFMWRFPQSEMRINLRDFYELALNNRLYSFQKRQ